MFSAQTLTSVAAATAATVTALQWIGSKALFAAKAAKAANDYSKTTSLADITKLMRVEPLTVVSRNCFTLDYLPDVMQTLLNVFSAYYLQAASIYGTVDSVRVMKILDALNPDREAAPSYMTTAMSTAAVNGGPVTWGMESYTDGQTLLEENYKYRLPKASFSMEAADISTSANFSKDTNEIVAEANNLAVGKVLDVRITVKGSGAANATDEKVTLPITVRLAPVLLTKDSIKSILCMNTDDTNFKERYYAWRAGRIRFVQDLIMCQDLIDAHKKALMEDSTGTYSEIIRRASNAKTGGLVTKTPSLVSASNLFIIDEETQAEVERKMGGKLSNPAVRSRVFDNTYAMIIVVIDRAMERVIFYTRNVQQGSNFSIKEIKAAGKGKGPDVLDILKAMNMGGQISF